MKLRDTAYQLAMEAIEANPSLFLVHFEVDENNKIHVLVDGDEGLPISECVRISRNIEHNLDREEEDFSLEVSSPGLEFPLKSARHFTKNLYRDLEVVLTDGTIVTGQLVEVTEESILIEWEAREPKKIGKGKETVVKQQRIEYLNIKQAIVQIIF